MELIKKVKGHNSIIWSIDVCNEWIVTASKERISKIYTLDL